MTVSDSPILFSSMREVFILFMIPVGGGIPAGVVLANKRGLSWLLVCLLYFLSDVVLACLFDPVMKIFIHYSKRSPFMARMSEAMKKSTEITTKQYGLKPKWYHLILISFGVDPMTGRAVTHMAGHGFITGWSMAIAGDMFYFGLIMASTLWLNNILGDGTLAAVIVTVAVIGVPWIVKKIRGTLSA